MRRSGRWPAGSPAQTAHRAACCRPRHTGRTATSTSVQAGCRTHGSRTRRLAAGCGCGMLRHRQAKTRHRDARDQPSGLRIAATDRLTRRRMYSLMTDSRSICITTTPLRPSDIDPPRVPRRGPHGSPTPPGFAHGACHRRRRRRARWWRTCRTRPSRSTRASRSTPSCPRIVSSGPTKPIARSTSWAGQRCSLPGTSVNFRPPRSSFVTSTRTVCTSCTRPWLSPTKRLVCTQ